MKICREYNYDEVFLVPRKCIVNSRSECDTKTTLGKGTFEVPIVCANMPAVVDKFTCKFFALRNWFYIMHRFGIDQIDFINFMKEANLFTSISIGVNDDSYHQLKDINDAGLSNCLDYITLDIAHCHSQKAERMTKYIKDKFPDTFLIVGNYNTVDALLDIESWGADATKCGIAGGRSCITRYKTSFYRPMVSCLSECSEAAKRPIIADGGIEHHGQFALAIACGATMVMSGSLFSGYEQSASKKINIDGITKCIYYGSASEFNKQSYTRIEGKKVLIDFKGSMENLLVEIKEDLQSAISYSGGRNLSSLQSCKMISIGG
jgi:GMP reductase